ncbi:MAG: hypothetical protein IJR54_08310 [Oscillibacter sp.]|nr:hypothetical protein [Oscillibacter sp.]
MLLRERKKKGASSPLRWAAVVFCMAVALSAGLSLTSEFLLSGAGLVLAAGVLLLFILLGIVFDIIGVSVTAADPRPLNSMAAHKERGAKEALLLVRNANRVSSVCNDVVGDICGIVSGVTGAVIVARVRQAFGLETILLSVGVTALISGLTIGGKALSKTFAIRRGTDVIYWVGRFLYLFRRRGKR